jgi:L,D-peptidoglycan transpeptidase YkuD (ErfK/YbiS/YcfS/YnhG family)
VKGYTKIKEKVLWCKLSQKKNWGTKIEIRGNEGQCVNIRKNGL